MSQYPIPPEKLIDALEKRPVLYDSRIPGNSDPNIRRANWDEVVHELFGEKKGEDSSAWDALVKDVQLKWRRLRDSYVRMKRQEKEDQMKGVVKERKRNALYDKMPFLDSALNIGKNSFSTSSSNAIFLNENEEVETYLSAEASDIKIDHDMLESPIYEEPIVESHEGDEPLTKILKELVSIQKDEKADDRMGNKSFLKSLLPFLQKLPDDINLEVRLQLMSIVQTYSSGESLMRI